MTFEEHSAKSLMHRAQTPYSEILTKERDLLAIEIVVAGWIFNSKRLCLLL